MASGDITFSIVSGSGCACCDGGGSPGSIQFVGNFDLADTLTIQGDQITLIDSGGTFPTDIGPIQITFLGVTHSWDDAHSPFTLPSPIGNLTSAAAVINSIVPHGVDTNVKDSDVTVTQQPDSGNGFATLVFIDDQTHQSYSTFDFTVNFS